MKLPNNLVNISQVAVRLNIVDYRDPTTLLTIKRRPVTTSIDDLITQTLHAISELPIRVIDVSNPCVLLMNKPGHLQNAPCATVKYGVLNPYDQTNPLKVTRDFLLDLSWWATKV